MQDYEILDSKWWTVIYGCIGIVAVHTGMHDPSKGEWKAYIGIGSCASVSGDEQRIAMWGAGLLPEEAVAFFPHLDIAKYKKDEL